MPSTRPCRPAGDRPADLRSGHLGVVGHGPLAGARTRQAARTVTGTRPDEAAARRPWTTASAVSPMDRSRVAERELRFR